MKKAIVLVMHGMIPKDFPLDDKKKYMKLRAQHHSQAVAVPAEMPHELAELETKMRQWPRTKANDPFFAAARNLSDELAHSTGYPVYLGFNEFCAPSAESALEDAALAGYEEILVTTPMLTAGGHHAEEEIPELVRAAQTRYKQARFVYAWPFTNRSIAGFLSDNIKLFENLPKKVPVLSIALALFCVLQASAWAEPAATHEFTGAKKCSMCHKSESQGQQYKIWTESRHAKAFDTLATPRAKEVGSEVGVTDPQNSPKCLKCHSTAYHFTEKRVSDVIAVEEGVSCESCHGPGVDYSKKSIMQDRALSVQNGLIIPDEKTCRQCHDAGGPVPEKFDFKVNWDKIKHPRPAE